MNGQLTISGKGHPVNGAGVDLGVIPELAKIKSRAFYVMRKINRFREAKQREIVFPGQTIASCGEVPPSALPLRNRFTILEPTGANDHLDDLEEKITSPETSFKEKREVARDISIADRAKLKVTFETATDLQIDRCDGPIRQCVSTLRKRETVDAATQNNSGEGYLIGCPIETQASDQQWDNEIFKTPERKAVNKFVKNKKYLKAHSGLLNYLRCKYFMAFRDHHHILRLANEARIWLLKNDHTCDNTLDYAVLASAVQCAFLVSPEELEMRQTIKGPINKDSMIHLNKTMSGNFGKVFRLHGENSLFGKTICHDMMVKPRSLEV